MPNDRLSTIELFKTMVFQKSLKFLLEKISIFAVNSMKSINPISVKGGGGEGLNG